MCCPGRWKIQISGGTFLVNLPVTSCPSGVVSSYTLYVHKYLVICYRCLPHFFGFGCLRLHCYNLYRHVLSHTIPGTGIYYAGVHCLLLVSDLRVILYLVLRSIIYGIPWLIHTTTSNFILLVLSRGAERDACWGVEQASSRSSDRCSAHTSRSRPSLIQVYDT